jgi:hypothetical protein
MSEEEEKLALIKFAVEQTLACERDVIPPAIITVKDTFVQEVYKLWQAREATKE